ncbi:MAG: transporter, partial [Alphaproteobacteria bacterium]|nr:transporter [Alphaproteobacteria bacterium]
MSRSEHPNLILATCILASSLAFVDGSVTNVALPAIGKSLSASSAELQWVINAYLLPLSALLLLGGAAGDRYGRARLLVGGTVLFAIASVGCALAPNLVILLTARGLQGVGAAILMPNSLAILGATFTGGARGRATGIWASMGAVMAAIGPVLGGWLIDTVGWRAIFLINLPLAAGAIALALLYVKDSRDSDKAMLDWTGGALATAALGALTWGLTIGSGPQGWISPAIAAMAVGAAILLVFLWVQKIKREHAMMPLALFGSASFIGLTVLTLFLYGALGALMVLLPYFLIKIAGFTGTQAGSALLPVAIILTLASPLMGQLAGRIGPRWPLTIGPLVVAVGFALMLRMGADANYWTDVLPAILVISIGMSGAVAPLTTAVLGSVDSRHTGSASGFNSAIARTGGLIATALLGSVLGAEGTMLISGFHIAAIACA